MEPQWKEQLEEVGELAARLLAMAYERGRHDERAAIRSAMEARRMAAGSHNTGRVQVELVQRPVTVSMVVGQEYLVLTKRPAQGYPREHRIGFLGKGRTEGELEFDARPAAGTQQLAIEDIVTIRPVEKDEAKRHMNRVVR